MNDTYTMQSCCQKQLMPDTLSMLFRSSHQQQVQVRSPMPVVRHAVSVWTSGYFKHRECETSSEGLVFED